MLTSPLPGSLDDTERLLQELKVRAASEQAQRLHAAALLLEPALRAAQRADLDTASLQAFLDSIREHLDETAVVKPRLVVPRERPGPQKDWGSQEAPRPRYLLFVDETGGSRLGLRHDQPYFAVGGVLASETAYAELCAGWEEWKSAWIGRADASMHSRSLSRRSLRYYLLPGASVEDALNSLDELIDGFDFTLFVSAIDKAVFAREFQGGLTGGHLPEYYYTLCLELVLERVVACLFERDDGQAQVFAEARNRLEDARVQMDYQRLQIEGTLLQESTWFRYQLGPHITFQSKADNVAGLQLVDVLLRAVIEKLVAPESDPLRWEVARRKLHMSEDRRVRGWGLRILPHDSERVEAIT